MIFQFIDFNFDSNTYKLQMQYSFSDIDYVFTEILDFSAFKSTSFDFESNYEAFKILFLVSGISYYKLYACSKIDLGKFKIDYKQAEFLNFFYKNGLSEFIYKNKLDFNENIPDFCVYASDLKINLVDSFDSNANSKNLLAWGGGKDSIVSSILLDELHQEYDLFCVKSDVIKEDTARISGKKFYCVSRVLDSKLAYFNSLDDTFNGHVPITGILAFIKVIVCLMAGYKNIILSNEFSADESNLVYKGHNINHQFSKGMDFEVRINNYIKTFISSEISYFSLLRPFYEIKIAEIFSKNAQKYFDVFSSSNRNFHFDTSKNLKTKRFCCNCEKCAFVYLILAPFIPKDNLLKIFGEDLFENSNLSSVFYELCGLLDKKPFECVGTFKESQACIKKLVFNSDYKNCELICELNSKIQDFDFSYLFELQIDYNFNEEWYLKFQNEFK